MGHTNTYFEQMGLVSCYWKIEADTFDGIENRILLRLLLSCPGLRLISVRDCIVLATRTSFLHGFRDNRGRFCDCIATVSYTHLDVYKRQAVYCLLVSN